MKTGPDYADLVVLLLLFGGRGEFSVHVSRQGDQNSVFARPFDLEIEWLQGIQARGYNSE